MCEPGWLPTRSKVAPATRVGIDSNPDALDRSLRTGAMPIIGYIESKTLWFDMRTVDTEEVPHHC
jgi:seryl-tRNA(Sec) selenium transferase